MLSQSTNPEMVVKNFDAAISSINGELCFALKMTAGQSPPFELKTIKCEEKKSVICRSQPKDNTTTAENISTKPSTFPCIPKNSKRRNKREVTTPVNQKPHVKGKKR